MPWMNVVTDKKLSVAQQKEIKTGFASIMQQVLDKKESGLNVTFISTDGFYRGGESATDAVAIDIKYINKATASQKQEITNAITDIMVKVAESDPTKVIVLFSEFLAEDYCRNK
jgi:phenylpyruvate tautomerase PptA (4-oxalocrotonate tautomerase family)